MTKQKKTLIQLLIGIAGAFAGLLVVNAFYQHFLMNLSINLRMFLVVCTYWIIIIIPLGVMKFAKDKLADYGFIKEKLGYQLIVGIVIGLCMSIIFTLIPILLGKEEWVNNGHNYQYLWQFIYDFVYCIVAVGLVEEFVFRGFVYSKIKILSGSIAVTIAVSSILFGIFHFLNGNVIQMVATCFLGVIFCLCKEKIKNCTLLSLIIAHGVYDALITVWGAVF